MGDAHETRHDSDDAGFFSHRAAQPFIDAPPQTIQCPLPETGCDPANAFHAQLWAHQIETENLYDHIVGPGLGGPIINDNLPTDRAWREAGRDMVGLGFKIGDFALDHGGQVALDIAGCIPAVNLYTEGLQAAYHGMHGYYDEHTGHAESAQHQYDEAKWHGTSAIFDLLTGEGGELEGAVHEGITAGRMVENVHNIIDAHEAAWDLVSTMIGDEKKLPFFPRIVQWATSGAGQDGGER